MYWYDNHAQRLREKSAIWHEKHDPGNDGARPSVDAALRLQAAVLGDVTLPCDAGFDAALRKSSGASANSPAAIVFCEVEQDVAACLRAARALSLPVDLTFGSHEPPAGFSSGGLLIDLSRLNDVVVDPFGLRAWVGAGTSFRKVNAKTQLYDLHLPGGDDPDLPIGEHMSTGGFGLTSRVFGMTCDQAEEVRVMLSDGRVVHANSTTNRDLFWAVRGGAFEDFCIPLTANYRLYRGSRFVGFSVQWSMATEQEACDAADALNWLQRNFMTSGAPDTMGYKLVWSFSLANDGQFVPHMSLQGVSRGTSQELEETLKPVVNLAGATGSTLRDTQSYADLLMPLNPAIEPGPQISGAETNDQSYNLSYQIYLKQEIPVAWWLDLINWFRQFELLDACVEIRVLGGMIARMPAEENAFAHRGALCELRLDVRLQSVDQKQETLAFLTGWERNIGYFDAALSGSRVACGNKIRAKYDPDNLFGRSRGDLPSDLDFAAPELPGLSDQIDVMAEF